MRHFRKIFLSLFVANVVVWTPIYVSFALALTGCQTTATPQATMFATLQASAAGIDSFRASYETAFAAGQIDAAKRTQLDAQYNKANDTIIVAARAARDGMALSTPAEVDAAVRSFVALVTTLVPPKPRTP